MHQKYIGDKVLTFRPTLLEGQNKVGDSPTTEVKGQGSQGTPKQGSKFQNGNFAILTADLDSSQKSSWRIYFYFFHFLRKRGSKGGSKVKKDPKIDPSNHFLSQNFKMGIFRFWKQIWILLKKVADKSTFLFFIFWDMVGQKGVKGCEYQWLILLSSLPDQSPSLWHDKPDHPDPNYHHPERHPDPNFS